MGGQAEQAGCVLSAVGSLSVAQLRFAGAAEGTTLHGDLEILSLAGTLAPNGVPPAHRHRRQRGCGDRWPPVLWLRQGITRLVVDGALYSLPGC